MSGNTAINKNGDIGSYFRSSCGVKQGGPISPVLFDLTADVLTAIRNKTRLARDISGVVRHLILIKDLDPMLGRIRDKAEPWRGRFTSKGSRSLLIGSCLSSIPSFMMGIYSLPEGVHAACDKELSRFFWQG